MKELVVIERVVDSPGDPAAMQAAEDAVAWCFEQHRVRFRYTLVALDRMRAVCVYDAPDVEAVRATQRTARLPVTRAWRALVAGEAARPAGGIVVAVHEAPSPLDAADLATRLAAHGVAPIVHFVAKDGTRWIAAFAADDPAAVRDACAALDLPAVTAWPAELLIAH
jgi:hypothetical protein